MLIFIFLCKHWKKKRSWSKKKTKKPRGPRATSLIWETSSNKKNTFERSYDITMSFRRVKPIISFLRIEWSLFVKPWFPSTKDDLCQVWLNFARWFWRRRFLNFDNIFLLYRNYLPLEKGVARHVNKFKSPPPKDALCQVWLKIDSVVLEKKMKMWKVYRQTEGRTYNKG